MKNQISNVFLGEIAKKKKGFLTSTTSHLRVRFD